MSQARVGSVSSFALALALAGGLASCGSSSSSPSAFKHDFGAAQPEFRRLITDAGHTIQHAGGKSDAQLAAQFGALSGRARRAGARLGRLSPPSQDERPLAKLRDLFDAVTRDLRRMSATAAAHDTAGAKAATDAFLQDAAQLKAEDAQLENRVGLRLRR